MITSFSRISVPLIFAMAAVPLISVGSTSAPAFTAELAAKGSFRGASASYPASGTAEIVRLKDGGLGLKLHGNFSVRSAPDLRVWLSEANAPRNAKSAEAAKYVDLGRLKSSTGEQIYRIPADVDVKSIGSVVIWCRAFSSFFGSASLA